jgi:hypothetical protein
MDFEWDHEKAVANEGKHGVAFEEAVEVFADDYSSTVRDPDQLNSFYSAGLAPAGTWLSPSRSAMVESGLSAQGR